MKRILSTCLLCIVLNIAFAQIEPTEQHLNKLSKQLNIKKSSLLILDSLSFRSLTIEIATNKELQIICLTGSYELVCSDTSVKNINKCFGTTENNLKQIIDYNHCSGTQLQLHQISYLNALITERLAETKKYVLLLYGSTYPSIIKKHVKKIVKKALVNNISPFLILTDFCNKN